MATPFLDLALVQPIEALSSAENFLKGARSAPFKKFSGFKSAQSAVMQGHSDEGY